MKAAVWGIIAVGGFGLMLLSYYGFRRLDPQAPCAGAILMMRL